MVLVLVLSPLLMYFVTLSRSIFVRIYKFLWRKMWGCWWLLISRDPFRFMFYRVRGFLIKHYPLSVSNFISTFSKYRTAVGVLTRRSFVGSKPYWIPPVLSSPSWLRRGREGLASPLGVSGRSQQLDSGSGGLRSDRPILSALRSHVTAGDPGFRAKGSRTPRDI